MDERSQFHPVTVQWQMPDKKIGWIPLTRSPMIDATADKSGILVSAFGDVSFRIFAPGSTSDQVTKVKWTLPGLTVHTDGGAQGFTSEQNGPFIDVKITGLTEMKMKFDHAGE